MSNTMYLRLAGVAIALALGGCESTDWGPDQLGRGHTSAAIDELKLGRQVYSNYCAGCHGENGDGNGPAAKFLNPKPRDFHAGRLKFAAVASGEAPRDEDYFRVISHGLSGTAMPAFKLLPERERAAVITYIKTFYEGWKEDGPGGGLTAGKDPWTEDIPAGIAEGKKVYHGLAKCWSCHPAYVSPEEIKKLTLESELPEPDLRPNLYSSEEKESQWGAPILPPDFLRERIKTGNELEDIARVIASGVGGTAMPTWAGTLEPEQLWGLAYYVRSLALQRGLTATSTAAR